MTNFPTTLDDSTSIPVESASTPLATNHVTAHQNIQDAIEAVEAKVGVNGSAVTTSHDYKLSGVTGSDKSASLAGTEALTNKTLTSPVITSPKITVGSDAVGDLHYTSNSDGTQSRRGIGSSGDVLTVTGGVPVWAAPTAVADATWTTKGIKVLNANSDYYAADSGSSTAYVLTYSPAVNTYAAGQVFTFKAGNTNTTTTPTININSLGAKTITNTSGSAIMAGAILANGLYQIEYDGTNFQLLNPTTYQEFIYTATGTWVCPRGITSVLYDIAGGGGGGGGAVNNSGAGGGGGAGDFSINQTGSVVPGTVYTITIGNGGTGGNGSGSSGSGGNQTIAFGVSKTGGNGGTGSSGSGGGAGGALQGNGAAGGAGGSSGGNGTAGSNSSIGSGGAGGVGNGSSFGGGGGGGAGIFFGGAGALGANGGPGLIGGIGSGGGGASNQGNGGTGGGGIVVIKVPIESYI